MLSKSGGRPYGCRRYNNTRRYNTTRRYFASPIMCGFESGSSLDVFVSLEPLCISCACLHPAHLASPRATCPGSGEAPQTRMLEHRSLGAPGQSLAWHLGSGLTQTLSLQGQATWQTHQQQPARKPPPSHQATGKPIYFIYWERQKDK